MFVARYTGPKKPPRAQYHNALKLVTDELKLLYDGVIMNLGRLGTQRVIGVLIMVTADWPATADLLGFGDHSALRGCGECMAVTHRGRVDLCFGHPRTRDHHEDSARRWRIAKNYYQRKDAFTERGEAETEFLKLPYFTPHRDHCPDLMHSGLLGVAGDLIRVLRDYVSADDFIRLEGLARMLHPPHEECARPLHKLGSNASSFTADQVIIMFIRRL